MMPGTDTPTAVEVVHASERTRITRLVLGSRTVVLKEPLGPDAEHRLRHERSILARLRGVAGVSQVVDKPRQPRCIVLADAGPTDLASASTPMDADLLVRVASALAEGVGAMHRRSVLHLDITPANVVLSADGRPCLVDFALARTTTDRPADLLTRGDIPGTLAYLAPEQIGRTGRPVDERTDLYALGATLYELATGTPPFGFGDPLRLTHDHLARVPVPPAEVNPALPRPLSAIILHLLEKEPDNRYQTAEGLLHDLRRLGDLQTDGAKTGRVGQSDAPRRLLPPARLVGRDTEFAELQQAFVDASAGRCLAVLVSGAPGVGKTALVDALRPLVTGNGGRFVTGKFDQYRQDVESSAVYQSFRALGRLLLAEPEDELTRTRGRLRSALGPNAALMATVVPEYEALLGVAPDAGDPATREARGQRNGTQILRTVAGPDRPLVLFLDDLQWAGRIALGFIDLLLNESPIDGLLVVCAYREHEEDGRAHPLRTMLSRWEQRETVRRLRLAGLPTSDLVAMVGQIFGADPARIAPLAEAIDVHTSGNPYETVELLNALRREGLLAATASGWRWDADLVRTRLDEAGIGKLLARPVSVLAPPTQQLIEAMACIGGQIPVTVLAAAVGEPVAVVERLLVPALAEGLLSEETGAERAVRFRHDRIHEAVLRGVDAGRRHDVRLAMARRLAAVPDLAAAAAAQYLQVVDAVVDDDERRRVVQLLRLAADQAALVADFTRAIPMLTAALQLVDPTDVATIASLRVARHTARFSLGRLEEADEDYQVIEHLSPTVVDRAGPTAVQVRSLSHRTRYAEALALGLESLRACGLDVPEPGRFTADFDPLYHWLESSDGADDAARAEIAEPRLLATAALIDAVLPVAYFVADPQMIAWLALQALGLWINEGPAPALVGPAGHAAYHVSVQRGDYVVAYRALNRIIALGEARAYEPSTSQVRYMAGTIAGWLEPIEDGVRKVRQARDGLVAGGDLSYVGYTYQVTIPYSVDCAPSLGSLEAEMDAGAAFLRRTGNEQTGRWLDSYQWLIRTLRGEISPTASDALVLDRYADDPLALVYAHLCHAIAAAVLGEQPALAQHTDAAVPLLPAFAGFYAIAQVRTLRGLALAEHARATAEGDRGPLLSELDEITGWLAARTTDAPDNFQHLLLLLEAERAWAGGDFRAAVLAFDAAVRDKAGRRRPWHRALIAERAARFHLANGAEHIGHELLTRARDAYEAWGATGKVAQLDWAYPTLRPGLLGEDDAGHHADRVSRPRSGVTAGTLDLLGVLTASQALSSETSIERLHARVVEVLSAMTGATAVRLLLWSEEHQEWLHTLEAAPATAQAVDVPMSILRYLRRTREPLVLEDATRDDRFATDPYFRDVAACSLLALPVMGRGSLRAALLLENRLIRGAFTAERLDAVELVAAQLTVSLDNAQLYAELTASRARIVAAADHSRRRIERDLHDGAQQRLVALGMQARLAQTMLPPGSDDLDAVLESLAKEADEASEELRELAQGIHPAILVEGGLRPALRVLARRSSVPVTLDVGVDRLPEQVEIAAYFVVAEALTNAAKYAEPTEVGVSVEVSDETVRIRVRDDGHGGAGLGGGSGLIGLKDRVEALGGRFWVHSSPGAGTTVHADLPVAAPGGVPD